MISSQNSYNKLHMNLRYLDKHHRKSFVNITDREREREKEERRKISRSYLSGGNEQAS